MDVLFTALKSLSPYKLHKEIHIWDDITEGILSLSILMETANNEIGI